jgi:hypothetical protein
LSNVKLVPGRLEQGLQLLASHLQLLLLFQQDEAILGRLDLLTGSLGGVNV